jgi:UDPglucose 6-dehydrogenase
MARVSVFGAGHVGLVTGACLAELGHEIVIKDVVQEKIARLDEGDLPVHEPGLGPLLARNRERVRFTTDGVAARESADVVVVCVDTPPTASGDADLTRVWAVVDDVSSSRRPAVLLMKSTVPAGTGQRIRAELDARGLDRVGYVSNPEFTAEGTAVRDFLRPDRIVIGSFERRDGDLVEALHGGIDAPVVRTDVNSAEMTKLAANALLVTRISFINEIANVCELVDADVADVARAVGLDHRLGSHFLSAGVGYGGSCFPKDATALKQLASNSGYHFQLLSAVIEVNDLQRRRVQKVVDHLGSLRGRTVALLGLAFKPGTDDMRDAPSIVLTHRLLAEGARVRGWDAAAKAEAVIPGLEQVGTPLEALAGADAAIIATDWPELGRLDWREAASVMRVPLVVDGRNMLDPAHALRAGLVYEGVGRRAPQGSAPGRERAAAAKAARAESRPAPLAAHAVGEAG